MGTASLIRVSQAVALLEAEAGLVRRDLGRAARLWYYPLPSNIDHKQPQRTFREATNSNHAT